MNLFCQKKIKSTINSKTNFYKFFNEHLLYLDALTGNQYYVHSNLSEEEIVCTSFPDRPIEVNQKMKVIVNLNEFHLFDFVAGNNIIN